MTQPVNLNRFRKEKARAEKRRAGDENAAKHGRSKAERALDAARAEKARRDLDGQRQE
ncbi:DUF4169 family protein [Ponticoccus sp. (in: a-proteobacteria)]|uniref:DUF4169 family protein n=1 Tax=Ponticoccus sp. (in: a-proteobacteria) TaxID=1925025 RepID=UPI003AB69E62